MSATDAQHAPTNCENCGTPLQGHYCHECGQSVHNPTRHFGHALEEVFESFWHLDGRVFRTLRDLMRPGRVARNYLDGQRARYIAPLRLFVILSLLTFFVGKLVVHVDGPAIQFGGEGGAAITNAQTVAEVRQVEARLLKKLEAEEAEAAKVPGVNAALIATRARIQGEAASRIVEIEAAAKQRAAAAAGAQPHATTTTTATPATAPTATNAPAVATTPAPKRIKPGIKDNGEWRFNDRPWDEKTNPVDVPLLPAFVDRWVNRKIGRAKANVEHMADANQFVQASLGAVPTALFLLMPVFALLLKVLYLGSGRRYLEHLVVALYSHAWLLLVLLVMFVMNALDQAAGNKGWVPVVTALVDAALWIWLPIYLFVMQHRVYRDHWALTAVRYLVVGSIYMFLVLFVVLFAVLAGIVA
ncbi:DUF3667 domain-containing protein [Lysobacter solisilvae (ex Woo and Kim 2020)]|uniref:DUF3667 domain-containing protein n=1 Tax=Agrilutibacter terrestris TaxID=2865112 RepID=A0A7H0FUA5_9GAMM|nr:DUF3667 domain-containing protein [Lysobacter terrestris]QNP39621.1 DUF3667 domain-containing protein [Lysobacter terrestris]